LPRKILLADDSVTAQNMGRRILSEAGYEVVTVNNGSAALKKLAEDPPDLAILDIYMPGYGGVEVCQRIKENGETASIPVLLTVGKLEPFKAEEARRVHADAHLVKPFEASELLAALAKLEDKIVPRPLAVKKATKSHAPEAATSPVKDKKFADTDGGWKHRLTIPPPEAKVPEPEQIETPSTAFREFVRPETQEAPNPSPSAILGHDQLPPEITADEIAAIAAAAAAFGNNNDREGSDHSASAEEMAAAVSSAPIPIEETRETIAEPELEASPLPETAFYADSAAAETEPLATAVAFPEPVVSREECAAVDEATDAEVAAALESLGPMNGNHASANQLRDGEGFGARVGVVEEQFAQMGSGWRSVIDGTARWMAEEIAVPVSEASLILEEEMQKAYAAMAEFRPGIESSAIAADFAAEGAIAEGAPEPTLLEIYETREEETGWSAAISLEISTVSSQEPEAISAAITSPEAGADESAPLVEMTTQSEETDQLREEAPAAEHCSESAGVAESLEEIQAAEPAQPAETITMAVASAEVIPALEESAYAESAYAAAASVGTEFHSISHVDAPTAPGAPQASLETGSADAPAAVDHEHEAELAAAWAHWRQIRESIANPQFTSRLADAAAAGYKEIQTPAPAVTQSSDAHSVADESSAVGVADSATIASIVDSVLAELKPKLVAEIARKLGKEKK
jgi:CheY-like chemotaxis protein